MMTFDQITQSTFQLLFWQSLEVPALEQLSTLALRLFECILLDHSTSEAKLQLVTTELFSANKKPKTIYVRGLYAQ